MRKAFTVFTARPLPSKYLLTKFCGSVKVEECAKSFARFTLYNNIFKERVKVGPDTLWELYVTGSEKTAHFAQDFKSSY